MSCSKPTAGRGGVGQRRQRTLTDPPLQNFSEKACTRLRRDPQGGILAKLTQSVLKGRQDGLALDFDEVGVGARHGTEVVDEPTQLLATGIG